METVNFKSVIDALYRRTYAFQDFGCFEDVKGEIESLPRFETAKEAHWIGTDFEGYTGGLPVYSTYECSGCGCEASNDSDYCPDCGAKMAKGVEPRESQVD